MKHLLLISILSLIFSCNNETNNTTKEKGTVVKDNNQTVKSDSLQTKLDASLIDTIVSYYPNGTLRSLKIRNNEKRTDIEYYRNGNKKSENNYLNDTLNGLSLTYYENGQIEVSKNYKKGKSNGDYLWHRIDGTLKEKIIEEEGEMVWIGKYDETGKLIYEATYKEGKVTKSQVY